MKRVVCFGEALIDFLNTGQQLEGNLSMNQFTQFPGGAPANAAVAVAKLGGNASFAGQVGDDQFGLFLLESLQRCGVDTSLAAVHPDAPTPLAFVFLDDHGERSFSFRRNGTADIVIGTDYVRRDWFSDESILHFCSNTLTDDHIAGVTEHLVRMARNSEAIISFDVNLRHNLWSSGNADAALVNDFVGRSDIVKFSSEELDYLCAGDRDDYLAAEFDNGLLAALITDGPNEVEVRTPGAIASVTPPSVAAVDTTGGGDAFIGAMLFGLSLQDDVRACLADIDRLERLVQSATYSGAFAVTRRGAFPSFPKLSDVANHWML